MMIIILILILLDQAVKLVVYHNFMHYRFYFIQNAIGFKPIFNPDYSWLNSVTNFGVGHFVHILINIIILFLSFVVYDLLKYKKIIDNKFSPVKLLFIFLFAGVVSSLIDRAIWGSSLDYILLEGLFVFDLKDVYITIFEVMAILGLVINYRGILKLTFKEMIHIWKGYFEEKIIKK